jgi:Protein of unknown function (DUF2628)
LVVYNAFEPPVAQGPAIERAERVVFVRDGFHWLAAIFPAVWLLVKGLWLEFIFFVVGVVLLSWALEAIGVASAIVGAVLIVLQIMIGFEAGTIQGASLDRRGWRLAGTTVGRDQAECERNFFASWLPAQSDVPYDGSTPPPPSWSDNMRSQALGMIASARRLGGARA